MKTLCDLRRRIGNRSATPQERDAGTTLVELMVSVMILSLVIAVTVSLTIGFQRTNAENYSRQEQVDTARSAVEGMSRTIRAAIKPAQLSSSCSGCTNDAFLLGTATSVGFYSNIDNPNNTVGPSRVSYVLSTTGTTAGQLIETIQTPDTNTPGATGYVYCNATAPGASAACRARLSTRPIAFGVQASDASAIFKYYAENGARLTPAPGASLSVTDLAKVVSIELVVSVQAENATRVAPTTYIQRITLPNV